MIASITAQTLLPRWLKAQQGDTPCVIVDVRENNEYAEAHIAGSIHIPLQSISENVQRIPKDQTVYVICHGGVRSAQAIQWLAKETGYEQLVNVEGGMMAWIQAGQPVE